MNKDISKQIAETKQELINIRFQLMTDPSKKSENSLEYQELLRKLHEIQDRMYHLMSDEQRMKEGKDNGKH